MGKAYKGKDDVGAGWLFETSIVGLNVTAGIAGLNAAHSFPSVALTFLIDHNSRLRKRFAPKRLQKPLSCDIMSVVCNTGGPLIS